MISPALTASALSFNIHGVTLEIGCPDPRVLGELRRDFAHFESSAASGPADVRLRLRPEPPPSSRGLHWLRWNGCRARGFGAVRRLDYPGAAAEYDFSLEEGRVWSREPHLLREGGYLMAHSALGRLLDRRGLHRVHALGFAVRGEAGLLLLPSGGGKTSLFLELLSRPEFSFFSDDIPLLDRRGRLHAFPQRLGLRADDPRIPAGYKSPLRRRLHGEKTAVDVAFYRDRVAAPSPARWLIVGERAGGLRPRLERCPRGRAWAALASAAVLGAGVPQVLELLLPAPPRFAGAADLALAAAGRFAAARALLSSAEALRFSMPEDPARSAGALADFLSREGHGA